MRKVSIAHPLEGLLADAGVSKSSRIQITAESGLVALLWLLRRGYEDVTLCGRTARPPLARPTCSWWRRAAQENGLADLLENGPPLAPGGLLIVQTPHAASGRQDPCPRLLSAHGLSLERRLSGLHRDVHVARRVALAKAA